MFTNNHKYTIELDGLTYSGDGNHLEQVVNLNAVDNYCIFVSDMQEAVSRTSLVEADVKYVELITRKNLREAGEFDEPISVIPHWKKKRGRNSTEICFTALPSRLFLQYQDQINENDHAVLLLPLYTVLLDALKKRRSRNPIAVTFMHGRFVDMIIGTKHRVYYANRCVAFDTSSEQVESLWNTVKSDVEAVEKENSIELAEIFHLDWIDSQPPPEWLKNAKNRFNQMEPEPVSIDGETHNISFLKAIRETSGLNSISPVFSKITFYTKQYTPHLNILLLLAIISCLALYYSFHKKSDDLQSTIIGIEQNAFDLAKRQGLDIVSAKNSKNTLNFIQNLSFSKNAPTYKNVINQVSDAFSPFAASDIKLKEIKIDYSDNSVQIEVAGKINAPFDTAYQGFQTVASRLNRMGYTIDKNNFDTQIRTSTFLLRLSKRIQ